MDKVFVVSYYDDGDAPVVTVYDNEDAAASHYNFALMVGGHKKVCIDECPIYESFTVYE